MSEGYRVDDVAGAGLAAAGDEQAGDPAGQSLAIRGQVVEALIEEAEIRELAHGADHGVHFEREFGAREDVGSSPAALVDLHSLARLGKLHTGHLPILRPDAGGRRALA